MLRSSFSLPAPSRKLEAASEISRSVFKSWKAAGHLASFPFMAVGCLLSPAWAQLHQSDRSSTTRVKQREGGVLTEPRSSRVYVRLTGGHWKLRQFERLDPTE